MDNLETCENCYWYWSLSTSREGCMFPGKRYHKETPCGYWEPKLETKEPDAAEVYEQYQKEWN